MEVTSNMEITIDRDTNEHYKLQDISTDIVNTSNQEAKTAILSPSSLKRMFISSLLALTFTATSTKAKKSLPKSFRVDSAITGVQSEYQGSVETLAVPAVEQARFITFALGLSKTDIAGVFGISRPALYAWLSGKSDPKGQNLEKLKNLYSILINGGTKEIYPLLGEFINNTLPGQNMSIKDLLCSEDWDLEQLRDLIEQACNLTSEHNKRLARILSAGKTSPEQQQKNLEDNLSEFGLDG